MTTTSSLTPSLEEHPNKLCTRVVIALEHRFQRTPDGIVWTQTQFAYPFWTRYLKVFNAVQVVARVQDVEAVPSSYEPASGKSVTFTSVPYYVGPWQYFLRSRQVMQVAQAAVQPNDAVIFRLSSQIASCIEPKLKKTGQPYAVEVVSDPYDVFAPGSVQHPLRPFFRWFSPQRLKDQCKNACAASYVTQFALQERYPCLSLSTGVSDVELPQEVIAATSRQFKAPARHLVFVGTLAQLYKAPHILIDAFAACVESGLDLQLTLIGDGRYRQLLEAQVNQLNISDRVHFLGQLSAGDAVRSQLQQADLFVLPSFQEGLPRAMLEAMAQGLPCIGSMVGGIPELLPPEALVPAGDVTALARKLGEVLTNPVWLTQMSEHNLRTVQNYRSEILDQRRCQFYQEVQDITEAWLSLNHSINGGRG